MVARVFHALAERIVKYKLFVAIIHASYFALRRNICIGT